MWKKKVERKKKRREKEREKREGERNCHLVFFSLAPVGSAEEVSVREPCVRREREG